MSASAETNRPKSVQRASMQDVTAKLESGLGARKRERADVGGEHLSTSSGYEIQSWPPQSKRRGREGGRRREGEETGNCAIRTINKSRNPPQPHRGVLGPRGRESDAEHGIQHSACDSRSSGIKLTRVAPFHTSFRSLLLQLQSLRQSGEIGQIQLLTYQDYFYRRRSRKVNMW